jgi:tetratricopeptide (TPR) repeat protein
LKPPRRLLRRARIASVTLVLLCFALRLASAGEEEPPCRSAAVSFAAGRAEQALGLYQSCLAAAPSFVAFKGLAETYLFLGHSEEAINNFRFALAINPGDSDTAAGLGRALMKLGRTEEAAHALERAVIIEPDNLRARTLLAMALFELKQYELAAIAAEEVRRREPSNVTAAFILGASDVRLRLYARAVPLLERAAVAAPSAEIRTTLGKAYLGIHKGALALREFRAAEKMQPQIPGLYSEIGAAYADLGDSDSALKAYEKALESDPNDFAANFGLARLNWTEGRYEAAETYLTKARQGAPDGPEVQLLSAEVSIHSQDYERARPLLENVVRALPDNLRAHVLLSQVYLHLKQVDEAKREEGIANALRETEEKQREKAIGRPADKQHSP